MENIGGAGIVWSLTGGDEPWPTCREPRPAWMVEAGGRPFCGIREGDEIHGPAEDCDPQPCINLDAHHNFVPPEPES